MPYIICVNQPGCLPEQDPYAVATIEDARDAALSEIHPTIDDDSSAALANYARLIAAALALSETGGTIGPLPDGYVIDVRRVTWQELAGLANLPSATYLRVDLPGASGEHFRAQILNAYNK